MKAAFLSIGRSAERAVERLRLAEELGYEDVYVTHLAGHESLTACAWYLASSARLRVGTGVVPIYSRTPATMAQTAGSLAALSGGRFVLGLGVGHRVTMEGWHGERIDRPVAEMREYVAIVRAILAGEAPPSGARWSSGFRLAIEPPPVPILVAGLSPAMLRLAGEIADGVVLWLCTADYVRDVVVPAVREGRERAGLALEGFDIVAAVPAAAGDVEAARESLRRDVRPYFALPFYRAMIERAGFGADLEAGVASDAFLDALAAFGDVPAGLRRYAEAGTTTPAVSPIARSDVEATLRAAAPRPGLT